MSSPHRQRETPDKKRERVDYVALCVGNVLFPVWFVSIFLLRYFAEIHLSLSLSLIVNSCLLSFPDQVKLIVIDSIACHFRHGFQDMSLRNRIMTGLAQSLIKIATESSIAVRLSPSFFPLPSLYLYVSLFMKSLA